ncbi:hypothetical protein GLYMA_07G077900v4 [Glycine max]|uniref:Uncharacterized protein n=1 Tax=Glycine max TaxID=3847 RepID=A0A0R0J6V5_SOYBN|nr:hypothetical protein GLYMA_07G077900v4 [Glycine max]
MEVAGQVTAVAQHPAVASTEENDKVLWSAEAINFYFLLFLVFLLSSSSFFLFWLIMQGSYIYPFFSFPSFDFVFKKTINFHFQIKTSIYDCDKLSESIKVEMK